MKNSAALVKLPELNKELAQSKAPLKSAPQRPVYPLETLATMTEADYWNLQVVRELPLAKAKRLEREALRREEYRKKEEAPLEYADPISWLD